MSGPRGRAMSTGEKLDTKVLGRLIGFVMKRYRFQIILVTLCIILAAWVQVQGSLIQRTLKQHKNLNQWWKCRAYISFLFKSSLDNFNA